MEQGRVERTLKRKDPVEVLQLINDYFGDTYYPLKTICIPNPENDQYSVGDLIRETIEKAKRKNESLF